jgi:hypothetical protein
MISCKHMRQEFPLKARDSSTAGHFEPSEVSGDNDCRAHGKMLRSDPLAQPATPSLNDEALDIDLYRR